MKKGKRVVLFGVSVFIFLGILCWNSFAQEGKGLAQAPGQVKKVNAPTFKGRTSQAGTSAKDVLNQKMQGAQEIPNMPSKNDQASDNSSGDPGKRKLQDLDTPNPMERTTRTGASRAFGVETGTKGPGGNPVDLRATTARPPDPLESNKAQVGMPVEPLESVHNVGAAQAQKINMQKKAMDSKGMEAQATQGVR